MKYATEEINAFNYGLVEKKSDWHKITTLIKLRESLLSKTIKFLESSNHENIHEYLDDIRFANFEIINKIN